MANEEQERTSEEILDQLQKTVEELQTDRARMNRLYVKGDLNDPSTLAGEVVQSMYSAVADAIELLNDGLNDHNDTLAHLEEATYEQNPKMLRMLLTVLLAKGVLNKEDTQAIEAELGDDAPVASVLNTEDGSAILRALKMLKGLLGEDAQTDPSYAAKLDDLISKVKDMTVEGDEPEATESALAAPEAPSTDVN